MAGRSLIAQLRASRILLPLLAVAMALAGAEESIVDKLDVLPGFSIEHVMRADPKANGSWICIAKDPRGRLLLGGQNGQPVTRLTLRDGKVEKQDILSLPVSETMGMLFAFDSLYINGSGKNAEGKKVFGLFRCRDTKNADVYDSVELLREWNGGAGEHGAHAITLGLDGKHLYIVCGNFTKVPQDLLPSSPHRNYAEDRLFPRVLEYSVVEPSAGFVVRLDADGKNPELFAAGQRNTYDVAWSPDGELFGYDSDSERDWGTPWYRPTRVFHIVSGADHGFRDGSAKWPEYYTDSLAGTVAIGPGCPTGVAFGTGARFPAKYQKALYILDWTYGRLIAIHLNPSGASYTATWENLVAPKSLKGNGAKTPLNLTDVVVSEDGALYFTVGGRNTASHLFRVTYIGTEPTVAVDGKSAEGAELRALRHRLESFHYNEDPTAIDAAWPHLAHADRWISFAARVAIERQPVAQWKSRAIAEKQSAAAWVALLALARVGAREDQADVLSALSRLPTSSLDAGQLLAKVRAVQISISRHGHPTAAVAKVLIDELNPLFPSMSDTLNMELCQVLLALNAPDAVAKTVDRLESASTQEEQVAYLLYLDSIKEGWTPALQKRYFSWWTKDLTKNAHPPILSTWFKDAGRPYNDGTFLQKALNEIHTRARGGLTPEAQTALADVLSAYAQRGKTSPKKPRAPRPFVKEWAQADLEPHVGQISKGRDFEAGRDVFEAAQCLACHRMGNTGGEIGPDLTAVASRFSRMDILASILEPSKVLSEQFQNTIVKTKDGRIVTGRIAEETDGKLVVQPDPLALEKVEIRKADIGSRMPSKLSPMPEELLNTFTLEDILNLLAYLESGGNKEQPNFGK